MNLNDEFKAIKCCVVIPTYNNAGTLANVVDDVLKYTDQILVVNDGSTDDTERILAGYVDKITVLSHRVNKGKGRALRTAFDWAWENDYHQAITIDSDGQHFANDLPGFIKSIEEEPGTLFIGARNMNQENVPGKSSFGNRFSNFWFWVETGIKLTDTQSGYRSYPLIAMKGMRLITNKFEFEIEAIVKSAWRGIDVKNIPIKVHYEPGDDRISHFRPFRDFTRISVLNTYLVALALIYYIPFRFLQKLTWSNVKRFFKEQFLNSEESVKKKALSIGFGVFMGIFPIWGYQLLVGIPLAHFFRLNKAIFIAAAHISIPPFIPFIIYGSYKLGAKLVAEPKDDLLFSAGFSLELVKDNLMQYLIGAVTLSVMAGLFTTLITAFWITYRRHRKKV